MNQHTRLSRVIYITEMLVTAHQTGSTDFNTVQVWATEYSVDGLVILIFYF